MSVSRSLSVRHKLDSINMLLLNANMNFFGKSFLSRAEAHLLFPCSWQVSTLEISWREVGTWGQRGCETSVRGECCKLRLSFPKPPSPAGRGQRKECCKLCNTFPPQPILAVKSAASWSPKCRYSTSTGFRLLGSSPLSGRGGRKEGKFNIENEGIWIWSGLGQSECQRRSEWHFGWRGN